MSGLAAVTAGDLLHSQVVTCAYIALRVARRNGGAPLGLGRYLPIGVHGRYILVAAHPVQSLVCRVRRSYRCLNRVRIADVENALAVIEGDVLNPLRNSHLSDCSKAVGTDKHFAVNGILGSFCRCRHIRNNRGCDSTFANTDCGNRTVLANGSDCLIAAFVGQLDVGGVFRRHNGAQRLGILTVQFQAQALRCGQTLGKNHDLDVGGRTDVELLGRHGDVCLAGANGRHHTSVIHCCDALIGTGPGQRQLLGGLGDLGGADITIRAVLNLQLLGLTLLKNQVGRKADIINVDATAGQPQCHNHGEDEGSHLRFHRLHAYIPFHLSCT